MSRWTIKLRKYTMLIHRWMGIFFCALFFMWFASGIVMMYCDYPGLDTDTRLKHLPLLNSKAIVISPQTALSTAGISQPEQAVLTSLFDRPVYRFRSSGSIIGIFADTGEAFAGLTEGQARTVAGAWSNTNPSDWSLESKQTEEDQWTVTQKYRAYRPLWKFISSNGDAVYVSDVTGEVVQHTTRSIRTGAYFGAIPHWIYFTMLRRNAANWSLVVIWLSAAGAAMTLLGIVAGLWLYSPGKRYRFRQGASSVPFTGQKRWHIILGLVFGLSTFTWILSGMFSMSILQSKPDPVQGLLRKQLTGGSWRKLEWNSFPPRAALESLEKVLPVRELEFTRFEDKAIYLASESATQTALITGNQPPLFVQDAERLKTTVQSAIRPFHILESRILTEYEIYYVDRHHEKPLPALYILTDAPGNPAFYIDLKTGKLVQAYGTSKARWNRWLYHGLHSLDLPWLYRHRPLWDVIVIAFMLGGLALSFTGIVIAYRRIRAKIRGRWIRYRTAG